MKMNKVTPQDIEDAHSKMTLPYIYMNTGPNNRASPNARVPWLASQDDMLAEDWIAYEEAK